MIRLAMTPAADDEGDGLPSLREVARDDPEAVRAVAERAGPPLEDYLRRVLAEVADD